MFKNHFRTLFLRSPLQPSQSTFTNGKFELGALKGGKMDDITVVVAFVSEPKVLKAPAAAPASAGKAPEGSGRRGMCSPLTDTGVKALIRTRLGIAADPNAPKPTPEVTKTTFPCLPIYVDDLYPYFVFFFFFVKLFGCCASGAWRCGENQAG